MKRTMKNDEERWRTMKNDEENDEEQWRKMKNDEERWRDDSTDTPRSYCNNKRAIAIAHRIEKRKENKYTDIKHFIGLINQGKLSLHHVDIDDNVSNAMTDTTKSITMSNGHRHVIERRCWGTEGHWYRESEHARL
jgi:hypothetical protein